MLGTEISGTGIAVWIYLRTGNVAWLGALMAIATVPVLFTMPFVRIVDRLPRRSVMIWSDTLAASGTAFAVVLALLGRLEVWHLAVAALVGGIGNAFQQPAFQAAVPSLVTPAALPRANGLNQLGPAAGVVIGPLIGAPLVAWWGIGAVLAVDVASFSFAIGTALAVRFGERAAPASDDDGSWAAALGWLRGDGRPFITLLAMMALVNFAFAVFNVSMFALAVQVAGAARSGVVVAVAGGAMLAGSLLVGARGLPARRMRVFSAALAASSVGIVIASLRPSMWWLGAGIVVALTAAPAVNAAMATLFHERVPDHLRGRVFGVRYAVGRSLSPIGSLVAGFAVAGLAEPAMAGDGWVANVFGTAIGTGAERGAALILMLAGVACGLIGIWTRVSWINGALDGPTPGSLDGGAVEGLPADRATPAVDGVI